MRTRQFKKFSHNLLHQRIPENILPVRGIPSKKGDTQKSKPAKRYGSRLNSQLYKSFALLLMGNKSSKGQLTPHAIYSIDQINLELRKNRIQKSSDFGYQLQERKKLRWFYGGISTRSLRKLFKESYSKDSTLASSLFQNLEKRLDVVLYRSGFFGSIYEARQWILNKKIYINDRPASRPSYQMQAGDFVTVQKKWRAKLTQAILERFLLFFKNMRFIEDRATKTYPNVKNIALKSPLESLRLEKSGDLSDGDVINHLKNLLNLQTSRKLQKVVTNSKMFRAFNIMKAQNLEVSYKTLSFIYLYPPQKIAFPTLLDVSAIEKSF